MGTSRIVQVLGSKISQTDCPATTYAQLASSLSKADFDALIPDLYEIGRTKTDVLGDLQLTITNQYSYSDPKQVTHCIGNGGNTGGGGTGGGGGNETTTGLVLKLSKDSLTGTTVTTWTNSATITPRLGNLTAGPAAPHVVTDGAAQFIAQTPVVYLETGAGDHANSAFANSIDYTYIFAVYLDLEGVSTSKKTLIELDLVTETGAHTYRGLYVSKNGTNNKLSFKEVNTASSSGGTGPEGHYSSPEVPEQSGYYIVTMRRSSLSGLADLRINGVSDLFMPVFSAPAGFWALRIGAPLSSPQESNSFSGKIGDVLLYNTYITGNDLLASECYLANRWGIGSITGCN